MKMKYLQLIFAFVLALNAQAETDCPLIGCFCQEYSSYFSIECKGDQRIQPSNFSSVNNFDQISLRLKGAKNLEAMANGLLDEIELYFLDLSENQNKLDTCLEKVNVFSTLVQLDLSHNKLSIIKKQSFFGLINLKCLDLSYNQI